MAKKIKLFSKLTSKDKDKITTMLDNSELEVFNINSNSDSKKGVIVKIEGDELLVIMDLIYKSQPEKDDDDDDDEVDEVGDVDEVDATEEDLNEVDDESEDKDEDEDDEDED